MSLARRSLVRASQSPWLREHALRWRFVERASRRFLPGERAEDAIAAAEVLRRMDIGAILSQLGENITERGEAEAVTAHYVQVLQSMAQHGLPGSLSVKLTQLGLDLDFEQCCANMLRILGAGVALGNRPDRQTPAIIWIDMEASGYVDRTLEVFRRVRTLHRNVGVCLQSYLRRTPADLESLLPLGPAIRLVKGAYREPPQLAYPAKRDVDAAYANLMERMLNRRAVAAGARAAIATHDRALLARATELAASAGVAKECFEFQMLYGIQRAEQERLARAGYPMNVLISYGSAWFPWYMRRLAERPANVWFVMKNLFS
jgi:proline dehydrogenase